MSIEEGYNENAAFSVEDLTHNNPAMKKSFKLLLAPLQQLLALLQHCHGRGILHQDFMVSALLIDKYRMLKIVGSRFGNSFNSEKEHPISRQVVTFWQKTLIHEFGLHYWGS